MKTLIVDQQEVFEHLASGMLKETDTDLINATSAEQAINIINSNDKINCICLATHLDNIDGIELCKKIRSRPGYRHIPILLLTDKNEPQLIERASMAGITDIFVKNKAKELANYLNRFSQINKPLTGKILYIEDDKSQSMVLESILKSRNLEVDTFEKAEDAWESFFIKEYDLVITDIVLMGEMSGVMLINRIRRVDGYKGDIPILAITGYDDVSRRVSLYHMGINDYIAKPVIPEELISRVRNLLAKNLQSSQSQ